MTQEEKQLLLQDLCARLPYGVCVHIRYKEGEPCYGKLTPRDIQWFIDSNIENIKPYLRPMSSMTEEEQKELEKIIDGILGYKARNYFHSEDDYKWNTLYEAIDWLNSHHFDYRGLIEKGLAWVAPEGMYNKH
jgi:uncharacterized protein with von Willebrand factor type A (vWA) domain